ncbi:hypothetical protein J2W42_006423 [Rhizobium tibeticum]|nr:hypothetical protein [Rhizobium tibeticum]
MPDGPKALSRKQLPEKEGASLFLREGRAVGSLAECLEGGLVPDPGAAKPHRHGYLPLLSGYEGGFVYPSADALADFVDIFHCCVWQIDPDFVGGNAGDEITMAHGRMDDPSNRLKQCICPLRSIATTDLIEVADSDNENDAIRAFRGAHAPAVYRMLDGGRKCVGAQCNYDGIVVEGVLKFFLEITKRFFASVKRKLQRKCNSRRYQRHSR